MGQRPPISAATKFCAVIGNPIGHSLSPAIHNAAYEATEADFVYAAFRVEDAASAIGGMRALENFRGMSVTIPHKLAAMEAVDEVAEIDQRIGSINSVVNENGKLFGFGTDGPGALKALRDAGAELAGKTVLMLGAGGAARAIAFTLVDQAELAELTVLDIDQDVLSQLGDSLKAAGTTTVSTAISTPEVIREQVGRSDVIINCTPIGMTPKVESSLVPAEAFRADQIAFDIVYTPYKTKMLLDAEAAGCTVVPGIDMFVNQAVLQFERFTGLEAPVEVMRNICMERLVK